MADFLTGVGIRRRPDPANAAVEDVHADVRSAMRKLGLDLAQPELFTDDPDDSDDL